MNVCCFVGRLTRDPELTYAQSGTAICKFTIAVDNAFAKQEPKADFIPVTTFGKTAESVANFMKKGRLISASGRWATGSYENNEGRRVFTNDLIADNIRFLDRDNSGQQQEPQQQNNDPFMDDGKPIDISDDDLPF